jgi:transposase-like protein
MADEPKKKGAPSGYREHYCDQLIEYCKDGNSLTEFASSIGVSRSTIYKWFNLYPEFLHAKRVALTHAESWWQTLGKEHARNNPNTWQFIMKARFGWRDSDSKNSEIEEEDEIDEPLKPDAITDK